MRCKKNYLIFPKEGKKSRTYKQSTHYVGYDVKVFSKHSCIDNLVLHGTMMGGDDHEMVEPNEGQWGTALRRD
jgi:hypothetical protein